MTRTQTDTDTGPVMLYYKPHRTHRDMAAQIGAELIEAEDGRVLERLRDALSTDLGDRPVILEGGVPLLQGAAMKLLNHTGPVILLAADETLTDIGTPLPYYSRVERLAHRVTLHAVDGIIAVSPERATEARVGADAPTKLAYPYLTPERKQVFEGLTPTPGSEKVVFAGGDKPPNGVDRLTKIANRLPSNVDVEIHVMGNRTDQRADTGSVTHHGYVTEQRMQDLFEEASLFIFPARSGAHPMATIEALRAGLPVLTTDAIGTAGPIQKVDGRLVRSNSINDLAQGLEAWLTTPVEERARISERARQIGRLFDPKNGRAAFEQAYNSLIADRTQR